MIRLDNLHHAIFKSYLNKQEIRSLSLQNSEKRNQINSLTHRLTGLQQMNLEQDNPIWHMLMQFPMCLTNGNTDGKNTDLTMEWQMRWKETGEIDSDYCRIIFYLNLKALEETIIDVHIQQRAISIHVMNNKSILKSFIEPIETVLKENLSKQNYYLSSITITNNFQPFEQERQDTVFSTGVDVKI